MLKIKVNLSHLNITSWWNLWNVSLESLEFKYFIISCYSCTCGTLWYLHSAYNVS
jgi:hypothetical protein